MNFNKRLFHCLYDSGSKPIRYKYYNSSHSCDIPENCHDMIILNDRLSSEYVMPFITHFRIATGETIVLFEQKIPVYGPSILKAPYLAEAFLTYVVLFCETSYRLGGIAPVIKTRSFTYCQTHPILANIHIYNAIRRNSSKFEEIFSRKKMGNTLN